MTNQELESCKRDIAVIKSTIERSKINLKSIALLFVLYGGLYLAEYLFGCGGAWLVGRFVSYEAYLAFNTVYKYVALAATVVFLIYYIRNYLKLRQNSNSHTLQLYLFWGIILFGLPLINKAVTLTYDTLVALLGNDFPGASIHTVVFAILPVIRLFSLPFALITTGFMQEKRSIVILGVCLFPVLYAAYLLPGPYFPSPEELLTYEGVEGQIIQLSIDNRTAYGGMIQCICYVVMGIILYPKKRNRHEAVDPIETIE
jgi:hypothetical protein